MSWEYRPAFDAGHRAALQSGKNLVFVCPPAAWAVLPLLEHLPRRDAPGTDTLVLLPDVAAALDLAAALAGVDARAPAFVVSGLARTQRLLAAGAIRTLLATPIDALELVRRAALKAERLRHVAVCWPDQHHSPDQTEALDFLLAESKSAGRHIASVDPVRDAAFIERHARRAPVGFGGRLPEVPGPALRYAVSDRERLGRAVRALLDTLNPASAFVWHPSGTLDAVGGDPSVTVGALVPDEPVEVAVAADLPSADALTALRVIAREVIVVVRPTQVAYLGTLATPIKAFPLPSEADRARDAAFGLRARLRERLARGGMRGDLIALAPLFDEYDPAVVAAAAVQDLVAGSFPPADPRSDVPAWVIVRLDVGRRESLRPADIVGALINVAGLPKNDVGLVDIRESFTLVYVRAESAERARQGLDGHAVRGRKVVARLDRR